METLLIAVLLPIVAVTQGGRSSKDLSYEELVTRFDYDNRAPLDLRERSVEDRAGVRVHDISYASPKGGRVPAYLVVPEGKGPFAAVIWGHWYLGQFRVPQSPRVPRRGGRSRQVRRRLLAPRCASGSAGLLSRSIAPQREAD